VWMWNQMCLNADARGLNDHVTADGHLADPDE